MQTKSSHLKKIRLQAGLTAIEAAKLLSITPQYLSKIENGKQIPSESLLLNMTRAYKLETNDAQLLLQKYDYMNSPHDAQFHQSGGDQEVTTVSNIKVDASKVPVLYTDALFITSNAYGISVDIGQKLASTNEIQIVSRVAFSLKHAEDIYKLLGDHIEMLRRNGIKN
jgi:transcriptional regulator with XRE-family HTH domain